MSEFLGERGIFGLVRAGNRKLLVGGVLASAVNAAGTIALIGFVKHMMDDHGAPTLQAGLLLLGLLCVILLAHIASGSWISGLGALEMAGLRRRLAAALTAADYERIERLGLHRVYAAFSEDLPRISMAFSAMPAVLLNSVIVVCGLGFLAYISPRHLLLMSALIGVALLVSERVLLRQMKLYGERLRESMNELYRQIQALVYGSKEMKLNARREAFFRDRLFERSVQDIYASSRRREFFISAYNGWSASIALILLAGILWISQGWMPMARGEMIAFALVLMFLRGPVIAIVNNVPHLSAAQVALKNIRALQLATRDPAGAEVRHDASNSPWREITLHAAGFEYASEDGSHSFRLAPASLTIHRGEVLYITGGNGSGKSTLAKLIAGLYRPTTGSIRVDGTAVTNENLGWYRAHFSAIFGDYYLFKEVLDGSGELLRDEALDAFLTKFGLDQRVRAVAGSFSTLALSQGQRKRLALIVALAEDRPILLFDEWAAEQDPEFRRTFYHEIIPALQASGKTVIAITHDDHYFHTADRIVRLDQGEMQISRPEPVKSHARVAPLRLVPEDSLQGAG
jgi:multidrug/microcin transport system ATP-binding/permease protein